MKTNFENIHNTLFRIVNKMLALEKSPVDSGSGEMLTMQEIHTLVAVAKEPGINVTSLAHRGGVTKGAVSQMIKKLSAKDYVRRMRPIGDDREICLFLTDKGSSAARRHQESHKELFNHMLSELGNFSESEFLCVDRFLRALETHLDSHEFKSNITVR